MPIVNWINITYQIAGLKHSKYKNLDKLKVGDRLSLSPSFHPKDSFAIQLLDSSNKFVGYVPKDFSENISNLLAMGCLEETQIIWNLNKEITVKTRITISDNNNTTQPTRTNEQSINGV